MNKVVIGSIAVIFGGLILSLEIYCLKFIRLMEINSGLPWRESDLAYLQEPTVILAILISVGIIIYGLILIIQGKNSNTP